MNQDKPMPPCPNCGSSDREPYETRQPHKHGKKDCDRGLKCTIWLIICWNCRIAR